MIKYNINSKIYVLILFIAITLPGLSFAAERLAVMDLEVNTGVDLGLGQALSEEIRTDIHNLCGYEVISKKDIEAVSKNMKTQYAFGVEKDLQWLIDFGHQLETRYMVAGSVSRIDSTYSISLRLIDTKGKDAGVKKRVMKKCRKKGDLFDAAKAAAADLMDCKHVKTYRHSVSAVVDAFRLSISDNDVSFFLFGGQYRYHLKTLGVISVELFSGKSTDTFYYGYKDTIYHVDGGNAKLFRAGFLYPAFKSTNGITLFAGGGFENLIISFDLENNGSTKVDKKNLFIDAGINYTFEKFFTELRGRYVLGEDDNLDYKHGMTACVGIKF